MNVEDSPRPANDHPDIEDLVAYVDGELGDDFAGEVRAHVAACATCAAVLARVGEPLEADEPSDEQVELYDFVALEPQPVFTDPQPGEVWQLEWDDNALLAVVLGFQDSSAIVAPATQEAPETSTAGIRVELRDVRVHLHVWRQTFAAVPLGVFSYAVATVAPGSWQRLMHAVESDVRRSSKELARVAFVDDENVADMLSRTDFRAALAAMSSAAWASAAEPIELRELLLERHLRPGELSAMTGIPAAAITDLVRGRRSATELEVVALSKSLGLDREELARGPALPAALVHAVERPVHRTAIRLRAALEGVSEAVARLRVAESVLAMPARTSRAERTVEAWDELVQHHLDA